MSDIVATLKRLSGRSDAPPVSRRLDTDDPAEHFGVIVRQITPVLGVLGLVLTLIMWPLDARVSSDAAALGAITRFRYASLVAAVSLIVGPRLPGVRDVPLAFVTGVLVLFSTASGAALGHGHGLGHPTFWAWPLFCYLLMPIPMQPGRRLLAHGGALIGFAAAYMAQQEIRVVDHPRFIVALSVIGSTIVMSTWLGNLVTRLMVRSFEQSRQLERERQRSEHLLQSVLPPSIAERLKDHPGAIADRVDEATVLFADICGFTPMATDAPPDEVVRLLNEIFSVFDELTTHLGLEKIKTIGDAYMVAANLPKPRADHTQAIAELALMMMKRAETLVGLDGEPLRLRIGIHRGPVVAGVIGSRKISYDVWGDTVNLASRMESHGEPGRIQVSDAVHDVLTEAYDLSPRGEVAIKGRTTMVTWFLEGRRADAGPFVPSVKPEDMR